MEEKKSQHKLSGSKKIKFIFFTLIFLFVLLTLTGELLLYFFHYDSSYDRMKRFTVQPAKWWTDDSVSGPRFVQKQADQSDSIMFGNGAARSYYNRLKIVNNEGYHDRDDFTQLNSGTDSVKVLFIGDSFTWGASADVGSSYVDVFEKDIKEKTPAVVWNTGIPATGTNHALFTAKKFLPLQHSNYVILGFCCVNDFADNLVPFDRLYFTTKGSCLNLYNYDKDFHPVKTTVEDAFINATGSRPMEELNLFQKIKIRSRLYPFLLNLKGELSATIKGWFQKSNAPDNRVPEQEYKVTKDYLSQLKQYVADNNAELIVLLIPHKDDLIKEGSNYLRSLRVCKELGLNYLEVIRLFKDTDYVENKWDGHWNNSGHQITGHALSQYLLKSINEKSKDTSQIK